MALELDRLDDAARGVAAVGRLFARDATVKPNAVAMREVVNVRAFEADIAARRGNPREGERIARQALTTATELGVPATQTRTIHRVLGDCLLDQRKYREAQAAFTLVTELGRKRDARADQIAIGELGIARAELGLGLREQARKRARAALAVLVKFKAHIRAPRQASEILGEPPKRKR
jgi:hypothetical protein